MVEVLLASIFLSISLPCFAGQFRSLSPLAIHQVSQYSTSKGFFQYIAFPSYDHLLLSLNRIFTIGITQERLSLGFLLRKQSTHE